MKPRIRRVESSPETSGTPATVVCVDDHAALLSSLRRVFQQQGWTVETATDGRTAMELVRRIGADALLVDLRLPDMTGIELIRKVGLSGCNVTAILYTAYPDVPTAIEATKLGVEYLSKHELHSLRHVAVAISKAVAVSRSQRGEPSDPALRRLERLTSALAKPTSDDWKEQCQSQLVCAVAEAKTLVAFVTAVDVLARVADHRTSCDEARALLQLQTRRYRRRDEAAQALRLDLFLDTVECSAPFRPDPPTWNAPVVGVTSVDFEKALRLLGWSGSYLRRIAVLKSAVTLVAHTREQTSQIGYQLGFGHPTSFDRFFRGLLGLSPKLFRQLLVKSDTPRF